MDKFKVGDKVEVVNEHSMFDCYTDKAEELQLANWTYRAMPAKGEVGYVVAISPHANSFYGNVYAVQTNSGCYLMQDKGIAPVKSKKEKEKEALWEEIEQLSKELHKAGLTGMTFCKAGDMFYVGQYTEISFKIYGDTASREYFDNFKKITELLTKLCTLQEKLDNLKRTV